MAGALHKRAYQKVAETGAEQRFSDKASVTSVSSDGKPGKGGEAHFAALAGCDGAVTSEKVASGTAFDAKGPTSDHGAWADFRLEYGSRQDLKAAVFQSLAAGATMIMHPQRIATGELMARFRDSEGRLWSLVAPM